MPLYIIQQDITKMNCDAIVNAAKNSLLGGGGVDGCIHRAAGRELLEECKTLGGCKTGDAKVTKGYNLPCKYVIHTVGPIWRGGDDGERELLVSCYRTSLELAKEYGCESVAFPLISSGVYGYPKEKALEVAAQTIKEFLLENEMTVYLAFISKKDFEIEKTLFEKISKYVQGDFFGFNSADVCKTACLKEWEIPCFSEIEELLIKMDDNFSVTLLKLIDAKGLTEVECYKKANVSKQTWYKIMNEKDYKPSKNTVIAFAIALELSLEETRRLLATVGFTLSRSNKFDIIIEYFITHEQYEIFLINEALFKFNQPCLGV